MGAGKGFELHERNSEHGLYERDTHCRPADRPACRLHPLTGDRRGQWSVRVSANRRIVFRFVNGEAVDVDLVDYH